VDSFLFPGILVLFGISSGGFSHDGIWYKSATPLRSGPTEDSVLLPVFFQLLICSCALKRLSSHTYNVPSLINISHGYLFSGSSRLPTTMIRSPAHTMHGLLVSTRSFLRSRSERRFGNLAVDRRLSPASPRQRPPKWHDVLSRPDTGSNRDRTHITHVTDHKPDLVSVARIKSSVAVTPLPLPPTIQTSPFPATCPCRLF